MSSDSTTATATARRRPPMRWPMHQCGSDREHVQQRGGRVQGPPGGAEEAVAGREEPEAQRPGMAPLHAVTADAPGQADEGRVGPTDVADPELGHGQVEHGRPRRAAEGDGAGDQRAAPRGR